MFPVLLKFCHPDFSYCHFTMMFLFVLTISIACVFILEEDLSLLPIIEILSKFTYWYINPPQSYKKKNSTTKYFLIITYFFLKSACGIQKKCKSLHIYPFPPPFAETNRSPIVYLTMVSFEFPETSFSFLNRGLGDRGCCMLYLTPLWHNCDLWYWAIQIKLTFRHSLIWCSVQLLTGF